VVDPSWMKSGSRYVRRMHENEDEECAVFIGGVDHYAALELALEMTELQTQRRYLL
jgi:hypothetical protein